MWSTISSWGVCVLCGVEGPSYRLKQHNLSNTGGVYLLCKHWIKTLYYEREREREERVSYAAGASAPKHQPAYTGYVRVFFLFLISLFNSFLYSLAQLQAPSLKREWIRDGFLKLFVFFFYSGLYTPRGFEPRWSFIHKSVGRERGI